jgi:hypothetical protein
MASVINAVGIGVSSVAGAVFSLSSVAAVDGFRQQTSHTSGKRERQEQAGETSAPSATA